MFAHERISASRADTVTLRFLSATGRYHLNRLADRHTAVFHGIDYKPTADIDDAVRQFAGTDLWVETTGEFSEIPA